MQPYQTSLEETTSGHFIPAVVIGITDDKPGEDEEKINCEIPVVNYLNVIIPVCEGFQEVEQNNRQGGKNSEKCPPDP